MTNQIINLGTGANSKNGDTVRKAFAKVNANFAELYSTVGPSIIPDITGNGGKYLTTNGTALSWADVSPVTDRLTKVTPSGTRSLSLDTSGVLTLSVSNNNKSVLRSITDMQIAAGRYVWTFGSDGTLTLPPGGNINNSGGTEYAPGGGGTSLLIDGGSPTTVYSGDALVIDGGGV
jgi:hypothetical protein